MGLVFWFTGLSGAGKTTIAEKAAAELKQSDLKVAIIDGDDVRARLHRHLGFTRDDILENNRLISELCVEALPENDAVFAPVISPLEAGRIAARNRIASRFRLIYFSAPLDFVSDADVKGLYQRARTGQINNMIGVAESNPYEFPNDADLEIDISQNDEAGCIECLKTFVTRELNGNAN